MHEEGKCMAKLYVIMGKSSSGKDTIYSKIKEDERVNFNNVIMYTTRPMREGEVDGREYYFTNEDSVSDYEKTGKIIELRAYNTIHGVWKYFTLDDGQIDLSTDNKYLIIATLEAYKKYLKYYGSNVVVPIYIEVDDAVRIHRALAREDAQANPKYAEMCRRYLADEQDFSEEKIMEAGIVKRYQNITLDQCITDIVSDIIES